MMSKKLFRGYLGIKSNRAEFITVSFLIKIIITLIAIFVVIAFGGKIWSALFPSGDKNTIKSFDAVYSLIASKQQSNAAYDSGTLSLYLADDHRIFLFGDNDNSVKCGKKTVYRPTDCDQGKNCMCLYDDDPEFDNANERDDNVAKCVSFNLAFDVGEFQINSGDDCKVPATAPFFTVIVAAMKEKSGTKTIYLWLNTEDMKRVDEELKKPICPQDNTACSLQKDGTYTTQTFRFDKNSLGIIYEDLKQSEKFNAYDKTYDECLKQRNPTIIAKCIYEPTLNKCELECLNPQIQCGVTYKTCEDYNEKPAASKIAGYIRTNTENHFLCTDNKRICSPGNTCFALTSNHYNCIPGKESECESLIQGNMFGGLDVVKLCSIKLGPYSNLNKNKGIINNNAVELYEYGDIINFMDTFFTDNSGLGHSCKTEISKYFRESEVLSCRTDKDCLGFIMKNPAPTEKVQKLLDECEMLVTTHNNPAVIITYDYKDTYDCEKRIEEYFSPLMRCSTTDIKRFVAPQHVP